MALYSDVVSSAAVGATAGTFDAVGTITLRTDAKYLYGFWVTSVLATSTAAEACSGVIKINSSDLGIGDQTYSVGPYRGGAPGTNIDMTCSPAEFCPMFMPVSGKTQINVLFSTNLPDGTGACSVVVGAVYEAGNASPPADVMKRWPLMSPIGKGAVNQSVAVVTTVAATAIGDVTIPGWAKEIIGFKHFMVPDLITAGEEIGGYVEYTSTIPDFGPQKWPFVFAINASLGTAVGAGASAQCVEAFAAYFPKSSQNETLTAKVYLTTAVTTGNPVVSTVYYR
jgi:hypothetical protein